MTSILKILEGIRNSTYPPEKIKRSVEILAAQRRAICNDCEFNSKHPNNKKWGPAHCMSCGCVLKWATHSLSYACPEGKWPAVEGVTHEQSNEIDNIIGNE